MADEEKEKKSSKDKNIEKVDKVEVKKNEFGFLYSRLDRNETIKYDNKNLVIPPRGKIEKVNKEKLSLPLPSGITFILA